MNTIKNILISLLLVLVIIGLFRISSLFQKKGTTYNLTSSSIVKDMQSLSRLETASFTIEKIIEAEKETHAFANILFGDKILLIAHTQIIAGFDLSVIDAGDIRIDGGSLIITMPPAQILSSNLNNEKTRVYDRRLGIFTKGDLELESQARRAAEASIRADACESDILGMATENAREQLTSLFSLAGFDEVVLNFEEGVCE